MNRWDVYQLILPNTRGHWLGYVVARSRAEAWNEAKDTFPGQAVLVESQESGDVFTLGRSGGLGLG